MYTYTDLYKIHLKSVGYLICGRNWGFSIQAVIIMRTGDKFHIEKENYDRLWQSFTERLEKGKNVTQAYPAFTKDKSSATHSIQKEGGKKSGKGENKYMQLQHPTPGSAHPPQKKLQYVNMFSLHPSC